VAEEDVWWATPKDERKRAELQNGWKHMKNDHEFTSAPALMEMCAPEKPKPLLERG
jgi:hypothetical protein